MVLMFTYLLGGALAGVPGEYLQFFLPGIMVMAVALITTYTGVAVNKDIEQGVFDRVRSLPVWQSSVLVGAMLGDVVRYAVASVVPLLLGLALGFRPDGGLVGVVLALLFLQVFAFSLAWIGTFVGVSVRTPTAAQTLSWTLLFVLVVASNVMVPQQTMPGWLEALIKVNPISVVTTAMRGSGSPAPRLGSSGVRKCGEDIQVRGQRPDGVVFHEGRPRGPLVFDACDLHDSGAGWLKKSSRKLDGMKACGSPDTVPGCSASSWAQPTGRDWRR